MRKQITSPFLITTLNQLKMQLILRNDQIQKLYSLDTRQGAYNKKRTILDAVKKTNSKSLTVFDVCKYENITIEQLNELMTINESKGTKKIKLE